MQAALLGRDCTTCWRLTREHNRVQVVKGGYFCGVCRTFIPRGRMALSNYLSLGGFFLLLMATVLLENLPLMAGQNVVWLGFLAAYSFFAIQFAKGINLQLVR